MTGERSPAEDLGWAVALHEAAHAVVSLLLGRRFGTARLDRWDANGSVDTVPFVTVEDVEADAISNLAGPVAESVHGYEAPDWDRRYANHLLPAMWAASRRGLGGEDVTAYINRLHTTAESLLLDPENWRAVETVARQLQRASVLTCDEVTGLMGLA